VPGPLRTIIGFAVINGATFALDLGIVSLAHGVGDGRSRSR